MADKLTQEHVAHVAHLARLAVSDDELAQYTEELSKILAYVDQLQQVDTTNVQPIGQVTGQLNVLQADEPAADPINPTDLLKAAPAAEGRFIKVKAVLE